MPVDKQIDSTKIGVYFYNGSYRAFHTPANSSNTYPITIPLWDAVFDDELEFVGSPVTTSLTGYERANPSGYRARVSLALNNSSPADSQKIRQLMERLSNQFNRTVLQSAASSINATTIALSIGVGGSSDPTLTDYYKGLVCVSVADPTSQALVTAYDESNRRITVASTVTPLTSGVSLVARPNLPSVVGVSADGTDGNIIYCNLVGGTFGIRRELTVGLQNINMELTEIERTELISDKYRIGIE